ncbi:MAG: hypothetical protein JKX70_03305 [Phycisphaerales bacterium]|nr:hypothetical protein [Phycisphaerales bacterium]
METDQKGTDYERSTQRNNVHRGLSAIAGTANGQAITVTMHADIVDFGGAQMVADFSNDGEFNFFDVSAFLASFSAGCSI